MDLNSKLLNRQIKKHLSGYSKEEISKLAPFLSCIDNSYWEYSDDAIYMERSLEIRAREAIEINKQIKDNLNENQKVLEELLEIISVLDEGFNESSTKVKRGIYDLSGYLKKLVDNDIINQRKLIKSEKYLRTILDSIWEWVCVLDNTWKVKLFNEMAVEITGVQYSDIIWKDYQEHISISDIKSWEVFNDFILNLLKEDKVKFINNINVRSKLRVVPVSAVMSPLKHNADDKDFGCIIAFRDITKEKELDNIKKEFLSIASHELRTPMTVINWYISILLQKKVWNINLKQEEYLFRSQKYVKQLIYMVNDMLDISKLEAWKMEFILEEFDIKEVIHEASLWLAEAYKTKEIRLSINNNNNNNNRVISDKQKISQVITNLLSNAYKFTPDKGSIRIEVDKNDIGDKLKISIKDSWVWISKKNISKLFNKFSQVTNYLAKKEDWTGLGLSISKTIVEELWWNICVESNEWKWSTFYFILPIKK